MEARHYRRPVGPPTRPNPPEVRPPGCATQSTLQPNPQGSPNGRGPPKSGGGTRGNPAPQPQCFPRFPRTPSCPIPSRPRPRSARHNQENRKPRAAPPRAQHQADAPGQKQDRKACLPGTLLTRQTRPRSAVNDTSRPCRLKCQRAKCRKSANSRISTVRLRRCSITLAKMSPAYLCWPSHSGAAPRIS